MSQTPRVISFMVALVLSGWLTNRTPTVAQQQAADPCTLSGQSNIDQCAWNTFAANLADGMWIDWSSTADLLNQKSPGPSGSRFVPAACHALSIQYPNLRVIAQVGKVADTLFEAGTVTSSRYTYTGGGTDTPHRQNNVGLSGDPVVASNGTFLRYEIILNPTAYDWIVEQSLYKAATLETWTGDLTFPESSVVIKNAWMELGGLPSDQFYTEDLLVYTAPNLVDDPGDSCEKKTMALAGQHMATKTSAQPAWTWATFEHIYAAPDCTAVQQDSGVNASCPEPATKMAALMGTTLSNFLLNPTQCSDGSGACASCNAKPSFNCDPNTSNVDQAYCVDRAPNSARGLTQACRQVTPSYYRTQADENQSTLNNDNYMLISTQWYSGAGSGDINVAPTVRNRDNRGNIRPASTRTVASPTRSVLGNSTMETYERSNCIGCHSAAVFKGTSAPGAAGISTDFMFWLTVEVPCGANGDDSSCEAAAPPQVPPSNPR
jgi:hypothetical protein